MKLNQFPEIIFKTSKASDGNMSFLRGDPRDALENRKKYLTSVGLDLNSIVVATLVHGDEILRVGQSDLGKGAFSTENAPKVDGLVTNEPGVNLFLMTADCLPVALFDPKKRAIGLIHAGWKGIDIEILIKAIKAMEKEFGSKPEEIITEVGPSVGPCCYVKQNTKEVEADSRWHPYLTRMENGISIDLWDFAQDQLISIGVKKENIINSKICTYCSNQYFSNRKFNAGKSEHDYRITTVLGMKAQVLSSRT